MMKKFKVLILLTIVFKCNGHLRILGDILSTAHDRLHSKVQDVAGTVLGGLSHGVNLNFESHIGISGNRQPGNGFQHNSNQNGYNPNTKPETVVVVIKEDNQNNYRPSPDSNYQQANNPPYNNNQGNKPVNNYNQLPNYNPPNNQGNYNNGPQYQGNNNYNPNNQNEGSNGPQYQGNNNYNPNNQNEGSNGPQYQGNNNYNPNNQNEGSNGPQYQGNNNYNSNNQNEGSNYGQPNNEHPNINNYDRPSGNNPNNPTHIDHNQANTHGNYGTNTKFPEPTDLITKEPNYKPVQDITTKKTIEDDEPFFVPLNPNEYFYGGDKINTTAPKRDANNKEQYENGDYNIDIRIKDE